MDKRKEVFEYLRNAQKAAEIDAKVDGVNIWVLMGGLALIIWQLVARVESDILKDVEFSSSVFLLSLTVYLLATFFLSRNKWSTETRYSAIDYGATELPYVELAQSILIMAPVTLSLFATGLGFANVLYGLLGVGLFGTSIFHICRGMIPTSEKEKIVLSTKFATGPTTGGVLGLCFLGALSFAAYEQFRLLTSKASLGTASAIEAILLLGGVYILAFLALRQRAKANRIAWTYDLERELLLEVVSPEVALQRIEHRALGPRFEDVMNAFVNDLDSRFDEIGAEWASAKEDLAAIIDIPVSYRTERSSRTQDVAKPILEKLENIIDDATKLADHLLELAKQKRIAKRPVVAALIPRLVERQRSYVSRAKGMIAELKSMVTAINEGRGGKSESN